MTKKKNSIVILRALFMKIITFYWSNLPFFIEQNEQNAIADI